MKEEQHETMRHILNAATEVFAEVGFSGARIAEIAKRANVNAATIYYHIGGKEELYTEVLRDYFKGAVEQAITHIQEASSPEEKLKIYIRNVAQLIEQNPYIVPIILRELVTGGKNFPPVIAEIFSGLIRTLAEILAEGERQQIFAPTTPLVLDFMITGTLMLLKNAGTMMQHNSEIGEIFQEHTYHSTAQEVERLILQAVTLKGDSI